MSSIETWRTVMLNNLRSQGRKSRASAMDQYNMAMGSSGAMSGAGRSATEGIAAQEAVDASGINAMAADAQAERNIYQKETADARKDAKKAAWIQGISNVVGAVAPSLVPGIGKLAGKAVGKIFGAAVPAATGLTSAVQQPTPQAAPSMQGAVSGQLQPSPLYQWWQKSAGRRKQFPQYPDPFAKFDTSWWRK
jgi:hypothetical protein